MTESAKNPIDDHLEKHVHDNEDITDQIADDPTEKESNKVQFSGFCGQFCSWEKNWPFCL